MDVATERTEQKGNGLLKAYNDLLQYPTLSARYSEIKFALNEVEFVNSLAAVKAEKYLEPLKDRKASQYIDTETGYDLVAKAESLVNIPNSINSTLKANGVYNFTELNEFSELADYVFSSQGSNVQIEVNLSGVHNLVMKIKSRQSA